MGKIFIICCIFTILIMGCSTMKKTERINTRMEIDRIYEEKLKNWPVSFEELRLPTRYGETYVVASGPLDAPLLLCFHAMGFNGLTYSPNIADLSANYRVLVVDTIGDQGKSIVRHDYPENIREYADWVSDLINAAGYDKAHLLGCSMGGWIAHGTAVFHPEIVDTLVLISPAAGIPEKTTWAKFLTSLVFNGSEKNVRRIINTLLGPYNAGKDWTDYMFLATADPKSIKLAFPKKFKDNVQKYGAKIFEVEKHLRICKNVYTT